MTVIYIIFLIVMIPIMAVLLGILKAVECRLMFGKWPHEDPGVMEVWKNLP